MAAGYITPEQIIAPKFFATKVAEAANINRQINEKIMENATTHVTEAKDRLNEQETVDETKRDKIDDTVIHVTKTITNIFNGDTAFGRICKLLESWMRRNKAASILITLPLFALATKWTFRKKKYKHTYNFTEHLFAQTYIASQLLLLSLLYILFTGYAVVENLYDITTWLILLVFFWDYKELFGLTWWKSICCTLQMFIYSFAIILGIILLIVVIGCIIAISYELYQM